MDLANLQADLYYCKFAANKDGLSESGEMISGFPDLSLFYAVSKAGLGDRTILDMIVSMLQMYSANEMAYHEAACKMHDACKSILSECVKPGT